MSIYILQEVHCSAESSDLWSSEWGYNSLFCGSRSSRKSGVCFLFNNNFEIKVSKALWVMMVAILCALITPVNIYAPKQ